MNKRIYLFGSMAMCLSLSLVSCSDDDPTPGGNGADPIEADARLSVISTSRNGILVANWELQITWLPAATRTRLQPWSSRDCLTTSTLERNSSSASLHLQLQDSVV